MRSRLRRGLRATFIGMAANASLAAVKIAVGFVGRSNALIADGIESLADLVASVVVWRALVVAETPADEDHPYGHGKAEPVATGIVAALLIAAAAAIASKSIHDLFSAPTGPEPFTLWTLLGVIVIKEMLFRFVAREARAMDSSVVAGDAWHHRSDAITSLAAAVGIVIALVGGPGYESADSVAALIAAALIAWNGFRLLAPAVNELMDRQPDRSLHDNIKEIAASTRLVRGVEKCWVRKMGYAYVVDMHIEVDPEMSVLEAHRVAHEVKDRVRKAMPQVRDVLVHIEPHPAAESSPGDSPLPARPSRDPGRA